MWRDDIEVHLKKIICDIINYIYIAQGPPVGSSESGNNISSFMKVGEFLDQPSDHQLLKNDFTLRTVLSSNRTNNSLLLC
jgi:hypothetical protein